MTSTCSCRTGTEKQQTVWFPREARFWKHFPLIFLRLHKENAWFSWLQVFDSKFGLKPIVWIGCYWHFWFYRAISPSSVILFCLLVNVWWKTWIFGNLLDNGYFHVTHQWKKSRMSQVDNVFSVVYCCSLGCLCDLPMLLYLCATISEVMIYLVITERSISWWQIHFGHSHLWHSVMNLFFVSDYYLLKTDNVSRSTSL